MKSIMDLAFCVCVCVCVRVCVCMCVYVCVCLLVAQFLTTEGSCSLPRFYCKKVK